ncbi:hypothetical protein [Adhaeribacter arboris]|nr:hypothetical protein [Adhaeribacter arboris]
MGFKELINNKENISEKEEAKFFKNSLKSVTEESPIRIKNLKAKASKF